MLLTIQIICGLALLIAAYRAFRILFFILKYAFKALRIAATALGIPLPSRVSKLKTKETLLAEILPLIRTKTELENTRKTTEGLGDVDHLLEAYLLWIDELVIVFGVDQGETITRVSKKDLKDFNISVEEALAASKVNLMRKAQALKTDGIEFEEIEDGIYSSQWTDGLGTSRILLETCFNQLELSGHPVVIPFGRNSFFVTGSRNSSTIQRAVTVAEELVEEGIERPLSLRPIQLIGAIWSSADTLLSACQVSSGQPVVGSPLGYSVMSVHMPEVGDFAHQVVKLEDGTEASVGILIYGFQYYGKKMSLEFSFFPKQILPYLIRSEILFHLKSAGNQARLSFRVEARSISNVTQSKMVTESGILYQSEEYQKDGRFLQDYTLIAQNYSNLSVSFKLSSAQNLTSELKDQVQKLLSQLVFAPLTVDENRFIKFNDEVNFPEQLLIKSVNSF